MNLIIRNILAIILGLIVGSLVNGFLISISGKIIPPLEGTDITTYEGLKEGILLFKPKHFIFPFLAHAFGTLVGAFIATLIAVKNRLRVDIIVGGLFLIAGIMNCFMLPAPVWFMAVDLVFAYIPMAFIGYKLAKVIGKKHLPQ